MASWMSMPSGAIPLSSLVLRATRTGSAKMSSVSYSSKKIFPTLVWIRQRRRTILRMTKMMISSKLAVNEASIPILMTSCWRLEPLLGLASKIGFPRVSKRTRDHFSPMLAREAEQKSVRTTITHSRSRSVRRSRPIK